MINHDYKFGDPIWFYPDGKNNVDAIFVRDGFGCAVIVTHSSFNMTMNVSYDMIKHKSLKKVFEGQWIPFPEQQPKCDSPFIVSIRDDSGDSIRYYTDIGWRSSSFLQDNAWIVDNEINYNVEAWMFMPEPYKKENK